MAAPSMPPSAPTTKPARRPNRCISAERGVAVSIDPTTDMVMGRVAQQMFEASVCPARPAIVKIIGICAPRIA